MPAPGPNPKAEAGLDAADGGDICLNTYVPRLLRSPACMCTPLLSYMKTIYCGADWAQRLHSTIAAGLGVVIALAIDPTAHACSELMVAPAMLRRLAPHSRLCPLKIQAG